MIPQTPDIFVYEDSADNFEILPSKTYRLDRVNGRIIGTVDGADAVMQFIRKVMSTDKYSFEIYDWYYGNELHKLVGKSYDYIVTRIPNIFKEALLVDDRILNVRDFSFSKTGIDSITVSCSVDTVYGTLHYEQEVLT